MKEEGYIPISRKLFEHPFWCEKRVFSRAEAWIDLLQSAQFENKKLLISGRPINVKRGQLAISLRFLAGRWNWSKNKVSYFLNVLISESMIKRTDNGTPQTIITICKYDNYNMCQKNKGHNPGQERDSEGTKKGQERDSEGTKQKKGNKGNKENNNPLPLLDDFVSDDFKAAFSLWLDYKKERAEKYKSVRSLKACYDKLVKLSGNSPDVAHEIVNQSMANNWAGLFPLKNKSNGNENTATADNSGNVIIRTTNL